MEGRSIGLDVHRDFCEVACCQGRKVKAWPRVRATIPGLAHLWRLFVLPE